MSRDGGPPDPLLHMHGQPSWHTEAYILGNRDGLLALRAAIDAALEQGEGVADVMVADGEGYSLFVMLEDAPWDSPAWERVAVPYTAADAAENRDDAIWPWHRQAGRPRMTRSSRDELDPATGRTWNGFDYRLQVWVRDGIVQPCGHPARMRTSGPCCAQDTYAGRSILEIEGAETRTDSPAPDAEAGDPLTRILERHGAIRRGDLEHLPDGLPVVMKFGSGHRASTTAGQAVRFIELLGDEVAEVYLPAAVCQFLRGGDALNTGNGPGKSG